MLNEKYALVFLNQDQDKVMCCRFERSPEADPSELDAPMYLTPPEEMEERGQIFDDLDKDTIFFTINCQINFNN